VIVHSPELPQHLLDTLKATAPTWNIRSPESAAPEVERIMKASGEPVPVVLSGPDATIDRLKFAVGARPQGQVHTTVDPAVGGAGPTSKPGTGVGVGPLHLAAPFRINSASPLFSPLLLAAPATIKKEGQPTPSTPDSELEARQLFNMDPLASVVVFTDPAALSKRDAAAAAGTVHWAWRSAGTSTVIFRRWGGDDGSATEVMGRFYEELRTGKSPEEALHRARAAVRQPENGRPPAAWAGWLILTGR
jgi:hypothetical protein